MVNKRMRRTKTEMELDKRCPYDDNRPKKYKSLVGKKLNRDGKRVTIVDHYYDGRIILETKEGKFIKLNKDGEVINCFRCENLKGEEDNVE